MATSSIKCVKPSKLDGQEGLNLTDWNNTVPSGLSEMQFYANATAANGAPNMWGGLTAKYDRNSYAQLGFSSSGIYFRRFDTTSWSDWVKLGGGIKRILSVPHSTGGRHDEYHPEAESAKTRHIRMASGAHNPDAYRNISIPDHFGFTYDPLSDMGRRYGLLPRWDFLKSGNEQLRSDGRCWRSVGAFCDLFPVMAKEVA